MFSSRLYPTAIQRIHRKSSNLAKTLHSLQNAHQVFDKSPKPAPVALHHSMIISLHQNQIEVVKIFKKQLQIGVYGVDEVAIALALKACRGDSVFGTQLHGFAVKSGFFCYLTVPNSLMSMYCKAGKFGLAMVVFEGLDWPDIVSYNTLLSGCGDGYAALCFARRMHEIGVVFDAVSYTAALSHCTNREMFVFGSQLHCCVLKFGLDSEVFIGNALVTMYLKWGRIVEAETVFCEMPSKDLVSWNALLSGYAQEGNYAFEAIFGFIEMLREGMRPDHVSLTSALSACGQQRNLEFGNQIHNLAIKSSYGTHVSVCNVLMALYSKSGITNDAKMIFQRMTEKNVVSWTTMLSMSKEDSMRMFNEMRRDGVYPNDVTFVGLIHSLTINYMVLEGHMIHGLCIKSNCFSEINVANCLITMYGNFEVMEDSRKVFEELEYKEIISWNALISGYAQNGMYQEALQTFSSATIESWPNEYTFGSVLSAIASSESISLKQGQRCHSCLIKLGLNTNPITSGALLDMYAKRGSIFESKSVFNEIADRSQVSWTAMISAYSRHGDYESVISLFEEMKQRGVSPDSITFLSVLTACGHKGVVDKGIEIFNSMMRDFSIEPSAEHYSCVVDMLGRAGRLNEAEEFMSQIPGGPRISVLQSLLGSCRTYGDVDMAKRIGEALIGLEPEHSGSYVLMSNLYAEKGQWEKVAKIRKGMRAKGVKKEIAFSWVDVGGIDDSLYLHGFSSDDKSHPLSKEIYRMVECLGSEMKHLAEDDDERPLSVACSM